ncbi:sensor histidine kinase [Segnochrobactrum spirostomi]|uniref:C4-dicarboxylate transport sensor protein DctB n=1 Tax=Segnochrobactrum spirostomi TaxID=2608987 RepID=A0A6A7Y5G3_9HYPH|nr:ATP-binding protein [Segnochrobactrum spirostomi]MQT12942.1 sensor histidine kinase [Segnochrobactrum spirostomi]
MVFALVALGLTAGAMTGAADVGRSRALADVRSRSENAATLALAVLRGELEKQRAVPLILARDPDVRRALVGSDRRALDEKFDAIAAETRSSVIYLLDRDGVAIAASNWDEPQSFVGSDYAFRDYYRQAMVHGTAEQFALGTVSRRPGLYISRRIDGADGPLGVIVVKVEFNRVEADWTALGGQAYVTDARGVVLLSTVESWRFDVERPLAPEAAADIRRSLQFGAAPLEPLRISHDGGLVSAAGLRGRFVEATEVVPTTDWTLDVLLPADRAIRSAQTSLQIAAALVLMPGLGAAALVMRRRRRAQARLVAAARIKAELEQRVAERTAELAGANARLMEEIAERGRAQERLSDAREELAKANRLATLGQVTAGVAHEINQPLAAIRTYAENARAFLKRDDPTPADGALGKIVALTERIGAITDTLRGFARRGDGTTEPTALADAIVGALMILDAPLRQAGIRPSLTAVPPDLKVMARRVELEQVLVNLMRNAIEALSASAAPAGGDNPAAPLAVGVRVEGERVVVAIADRGPGLTEPEVAALFTPFRTSKPKGLGLGLVICHDIVARFGGTLTAACRPGEGCVFTIVLQRASQP